MTKSSPSRQAPVAVPRHSAGRLIAWALCAGGLALGGCAAPNAGVQQAKKVMKEQGGGSLLGFAEAAAARGDYAAAIPMFRRAHQQHRGDAQPLIGLGRALAAIGQYAAAADAFAEAIAKDDQNAAAYRGLGNSQLVLGQYANAVANFSQAVRLQPGEPGNYSGLGVAFDASGNHGEAVRVYDRGAGNFADDLRLRGNYGLSLALHGDRAGIAMLEDVVRQPASAARDRLNLALAYALFGDYDRAAIMAGIDLDARAVRSNLVQAATLRGLAPKDRTIAMLQGGAAPKTDTREPANRGGGNRDMAQVRATIARLLPGTATPEETYESTAPAADPAVLAGAPPLMEAEGWAVQIAAYRKLEHLTPGWRYLSAKYADLIGGLEPRRSEVDHPDTGKGPSGFFYRLNAGPLTGRAEAVSICQAMQARGGECWVRAPEPAEGSLPDGNAPEQSLIGSADHEAVMRELAQQVMEQPAAEQRAAIDDLTPFIAPRADRQATPLALNSVTPAQAMAGLAPYLAPPGGGHSEALPLEPVVPEMAMAGLAPYMVAAPGDHAESLPLEPVAPETAMAALAPLLAEASGPRETVLTLADAPAAVPTALADPFGMAKTPDTGIALPPLNLPALPNLANASDDSAAQAEALPASFGATGRTRLGAPDPAALTISAFEEAEAWRAQEESAAAPNLSPVAPVNAEVRAGGSLERSGTPLSSLDGSGSEKETPAAQ